MGAGKSKHKKGFHVPSSDVEEPEDRFPPGHVPVPLKAKEQPPLTVEAVKRMVMLHDLPRQLLLQQRVDEEDGFAKCFHCGGSGKREASVPQRGYAVESPPQAAEPLVLACPMEDRFPDGKFPPGTKIKYYSESRKEWINAVVLDYSDEFATYRLDVHPSACPSKVRAAVVTFPPGCNVKYFSSSANLWIDAVVLDFDPEGNTYRLNVHPMADPARVMLAGSGIPARACAKKKCVRVMVAWLYQERRGSWATFDDGMAEKLNEAYKEGKGAALMIDGPSFQYVIDLSQMMQTNMKTHRQRRILRLSDEGNPQHGLGEMFFWQFTVKPGEFGADENGWLTCSERNVTCLEAAFRAHQAGNLENPLLQLRGPSGDVYSFDVAAMAFKNVATGASGQARRIAGSPKMPLTDVEHIGSENDDGDPDPLQRVPSGVVLPSGVCWVCRGSGKTSKWLSPIPGASKFDGKEDDNIERPECPICYCEATYKISTTCDHYFCETCIEGSLNAMMEMGQFPLTCPSCQVNTGQGAFLCGASGWSPAMAARMQSSVEPRKGHIDAGALTFLEQRNVITKAFQFRIMRQQNKIKRILEPDFFECPARCGEFLLASDPSYEEARIGDFYTDENTGQVSVQLGACPTCDAAVCIRCKSAADGPVHECEELSDKLCKDDPASLAEMAKIGKKCPACGMFIQKTDGCHLMMCGTSAHGKVADALRNGGCAYIFDWNTMQPIHDGHGYTDINGQRVKGAGPVTDRQVLLS